MSLANADRILIVDDDEAVLESLGALLESQGFSVAGYASGPALLAERGGAIRAACAIIDLRMPGMDGLTLLERLKAEGADFPVIVATGHGDVPLAVRAMKVGAADFIEKPYSNEAILSVIREAIKRRSPPRNSSQRAAAEALGSLTPREREVLEGLVTGDPNKIIAYKLGISPRTVEIHRANLVKKTGAESLSQLIRLALAAGIEPKTGS